MSASISICLRARKADPSWSIVMVGPVAKMNPASLPQAANLHYLGQQPYARLPAFLKGFDVCLMPFARNEATRSISPTKRWNTWPPVNPWSEG
jgi:hypothetical protein